MNKKGRSLLSIQAGKNNNANRIETQIKEDYNKGRWGCGED